jgi:hypothetical protein
MKEALKALVDHGGSGVVTKNGTVLAGGDILGASAHESFSSATWLRLMCLGKVVGMGDNRLAVAASVASKEGLQ